LFPAETQIPSQLDFLLKFQSGDGGPVYTTEVSVGAAAEEGHNGIVWDEETQHAQSHHHHEQALAFPNLLNQ
jgi:hypothetical protein